MLPWSLSRPLSTPHARPASAVLAALAVVVALMAAASPPAVAATPSLLAARVAGGACAPERTALVAAGVAVDRADRARDRASARLRGSERRLERARRLLQRALSGRDAGRVADARAEVRAAKADRHRRQVQARVAGRRLERAGAAARAARRDLATCRDLHSPARLLSAKLQRPGQILLTFNHPMGRRADRASSYHTSPELFVTGASRINHGTQVVLRTGPVFAVRYAISVPDLLDASGNAMHPAHQKATLTGDVEIDPGRPTLTTAGSTGNRTVVVQFSKPMGGSALQPAAYAVTREGATVTGGGVAVTAARFVDSSRLSIELTTQAQSDVDYRVRVGDVRDLLGTPMAAPSGGIGGVIDPTTAVFRGTAPPVGAQADSDCDTLTDAEEARGYLVTVTLASGQEQQRHVTSDPGRPGADCADPAAEDDLDGDGVLDSVDSDADGIDDAVEKTLGADPRDADSDDDGLTDEVEYNETYSDPTVQDTDGDGLTDGLESTFFVTSSILADTDGDQIDDGDEVTLANRNPRVSDLPRPGLSIGEVNLGLDVRFVDTTGSSSNTVDTKQVSTSLTQTESQEFSSTDSTTIEASTSSSQTAGFSVGYDEGPTAEVHFEATTEQSFGSTFLSEFTATSREETEHARSESLTSEVGQATSADRTREVQGATMQVAVNLRSVGDIAFTIKHPQVTALIQDPAHPEKLRPVATLVPDSEPESGYNLGPLVPERGPLVFSSSQVFPQLVDDLMRDPRGLVFTFSNYDVVDELGRNFAYTSQDINDRTAGLVIDYGGFDADGDGVGDETERKRIATGTGRVVDTNEDGVIDDQDHSVVFDPDGNSVGITLREALAAAGLREYEEDVTPTASLTQAQIDRSYSIVHRATGGDRIYRVRRTGMEPGVPKQWEIVTPTGIDQSLTLDSLVMDAGESVTLSFLADTDQDRLPAVLESIYGCADSPADEDHDGVVDSVDTDDDGLDDRFETLIGWRVDLERGSRPVLSSCASADTDDDGLGDADEAPSVIERDADGLIAITTGHTPKRDTSGPGDPVLGWSLTDPVTDPTTADTDLDGLDDAFELEPYQVPLLSPPADPGELSDLLPTSPEFFDSDRDTASDGVELHVGGQPRVYDFDNFGDSDGDGVVNVLEGVPYDVTVRGVSSTTLCADRCPLGPTSTTAETSNKLKRDTDGDGLDDGVERTLGTNPNLRDTDGDGLSDAQEVLGFSLRDLGTVTTNPRSVDTDRDKRPDGVEAQVVAGAPRIIVRVPGQAPYEAFTDPRDPDEDLDRLVDGDEERFGTDPQGYNTDGDNRSDYSEATATGRRPLVPDYHVTVTFSGLSVDEDGDDEDSAGDFVFAIGVRDVDGDFACDYQPLCGQFRYQPFTSAHDGPYAIPLKDCNGDTEVGDYCREGDDDVIEIQTDHSLPRMNRTVDLGSVGIGDAEPESFAVAGYLREMEGSSIDCQFDFPDPQEGENSGTYWGYDLELGTNVINLTRRQGCKGEPTEFTILATYTAS